MHLKIDGRSSCPQVCGRKGQPREWIYSWFARNGGAVAEREFAANEHYTLYRTGEFYDIRNDVLEEHPLPPSTPGSEAAAAGNMLQRVLEQFRTARPAAPLRVAN